MGHKRGASSLQNATFTAPPWPADSVEVADQVREARLVHEHMHRHDDGHHDHVHDPMPEGEHTHEHRHVTMVHEHPHVPDVHHGHPHESESGHGLMALDGWTPEEVVGLAVTGARMYGKCPYTQRP